MSFLRLLLTTALIFQCFVSFSGITPIHDRISTITAPVTIGQPTATQSVSSGVLPNFSHFDAFKKGVITFGVDHHYPEVFTSMEVEIDVNVKRWSNHSLSFPDIADTIIKLKINYYPNDSLSFNDKSSLVLNGVERFELTIEKIKVNNNFVNDLPANLYVDLDLFIDRYYDFTSNANTALNISYPINSSNLIDLDCDDIYDVVRLTWPSIMGAEEYQLEWTYINDYGAGSNWMSASSLEFNFKLNSTRISTSETSYDISLIYDHGYICYRVRAVGRDLSNLNNLIYGAWSSAETGTVNATTHFHQDWSYEGNKNWQYSSTFAEEGKRKEVISYFDGSLRNRQMVTRVNTDENVIVGETIYDHQGRAAIQVLPTPVNLPDCDEGKPNLPSLKYYPNFNQNMHGVSYQAKDFDVTHGDTCLITSDPMHDGAGASQYYSQLNSQNNGINEYIPDAGLRPFTQIEYTPDNTGRIRRQSGVGSAFQLGSDYETKYYYGQPDQVQLRRMFGNEVGDSKHYQKNMVVDPNGQISVSYLDQEGRVIATSLAGEVPTNMTGILSADEGTELNATLIPGSNSTLSNSLSPDGKSKIYSSTFTVSSEAVYTFNYNLAIESFIDSCLIEDVCFDCIYDFEIIIEDECGINLVSENVSKQVGVFAVVDSVLIFQLECDNLTIPNILTEELVLNLPIGSYQIKKALKIHEPALDFYIEQYLNDSLNHCVKTLADFELEFLSEVDLTECDIYLDCEECLINLGSLDDYISLGNGDVEDYNSQVEKCKLQCTEVSLEDINKTLMLSDLRPDGQYGEYRDVNGVYNPSLFKLSIYNGANILPSNIVNPGIAFWKNPKIDLNGTLVFGYYGDDSITRSKIEVQVTLNSSQVITASNPSVTPLSSIFQDPIDNKYYVYPENLSNTLDFIYYWEESWASSLLIYHPEYGYYKSFNDFSRQINSGDSYTSESFDQLLSNTETWEQAKTNGFINSNNQLNNWFTIGSTPWDPFVVRSSSFDNFGAQLQSKYSIFHVEGANSYSMPQVAAMTVRCPDLMLNPTYPSSCSNFGSFISSQTIPYNDSIKDLEWAQLKGMYISAKQTAKMNMSDDRAVNNPNYFGYNACIGNDNFNPFLLSFFNPFTNPFGIGSQFFQVTQPCSFFTNVLYENKVKRFGIATDYIQYDPNEAAAQIYLQTGQCPVAFNLKSFLNVAVQNHFLAENKSSINSYSLFNSFLMELTSNTVTLPIENYDWNVVINNATQLKTTITPALGGNQLGYIEFNKPTYPCLVFDWSDIVQVATFKSTTFSGGVYNFEMLVRVQTISGYDTCMINGNTNFDVKNCTFDPVCKKNDFTKDLQKLMNALTLNGEIGSSVQVLGNNSVYQNFMSVFLKKQIFSPTITEAFWSFDNTNSQFLLKRNSSSAEEVRVKILSATPSNFNQSLAHSIQSIEVTGDNTISIKINDSNGNLLATLECKVSYWNGTNLIDVHVGECSMVESLTCQGEVFDNLIHLEKLIKDVLINQNPLTSINLIASSYADSDLQFLINFSTNQTTSVHSSNTMGGIHYDTITFGSGVNCDFKLWIKSNQVDISFGNVVSMGDLLPYGLPNNAGKYTSFYVVTDFFSTASNLAYRDTIFGKSCLPVDRCVPCFEEIVAVYDNDRYCQNLYRNYLDSYAQFVDNQLTDPTCLDYSSSNPVYSYTDFMNSGACCSEETMELVHGDFIIPYTATNLIACPPVLTVYESCNFIGSPLDECVENYENYLRVLSEFNNSPWAIENSKSFNTVFFSYNYLIQSGKCFCLPSYISYLQTYIDAQSTDILPMPFGILSEGFPACQPSLPSEIDTCYVLYKTYLDAYGNFIQNEDLYCPNFYTQVPFFTYQEFINSNACCSTTSMLDFGYNYLSQFEITTSCPTTPLDVYSPTCPTQNDVNQPCLAEYTLFLQSILAFNQSPWAIQNNKQIIDFYTLQEVIDNERCYCLTSYADYLQTYIQAGANDVLPDPHNLKSFPDCSMNVPVEESFCEVMYGYYLTYYIAYLENYTGLCVDENVASLFSYQDFINSGICCSVNDLYDFQDNYLSQFVNPTSCPSTPFVVGANTCDFQNDNTCLDLRAALINKISSFNNSPWSLANSITLSYDGYFGRGIGSRAVVFKCECIESYLTYLDPYIIASADTSLPIPEEITSYTGCVSPPVSPENLCQDSYYDYLNCIQNYNNWARTYKKQEIGAADILNQNTYVSGNYCDCLGDYCDYLNQVMLGNVSDFNFAITTAIDDFCDAPKSTLIPCAPTVPWIEIGDVPTETFIDPCTEILNNTAVVNANIAYNTYRDSLVASFVEKYTKHCMDASESLTKKYYDREYHRTLYYYDQAGNLIKTIPPEGVELLNTLSDTDPVGLLLTADFKNNTQHVLTNHRMATIYEYNSLNQLIRQTMPDHDHMEIWDVTYPNGLHIDLVTTAIQMVNENTGYLSGYVVNNSLSQGYLYKTTNGGSNWMKMDNTVAGELKKIQMVSTNVGYAIGATGVILKSTNSGSTWNLLNTFATGKVLEFVDLHFTSEINGRFVSKDGSLLLTSNGGINFTQSSLSIPSSLLHSIVEVKSMTFDGSNFYYTLTLLELGLVGDIILQVDANNISSIEPIWSNGYQAIDYYAEKSGYIAGKNGLLVAFSSHPILGYRQTLIPNKDGGDFTKIYFLDQQNGVGLRKDLHTNENQVVYTKNGGVDWIVFESNVTYKDLTLLKKDVNKIYFYGLTSEGKVNRLMFSPNIPLAMVSTSLISNSSFALNPSIFASFENIFSVEKNGISSMILVGSSDGKVYRSEILTVQNQQTSFTSLGQLNSSNTSDKVDQLEGFISNTGSVSIIIKSSNKKLFSLFATTFNGVYTNNSVNVSGQISGIVTALSKDVSTNRVFAFEPNEKKMHFLLLNGTSVPSSTTKQNTSVTSGSGSGIIAIDFQGDEVTMINSTGEIYTSSSFAGTSFMNASYTHRSHLLATSINSILQSTGSNTNLMAVGDYGRYLERVIVNTQSIWKISPIGTNEKLNAIISVGNKHLIVGNNGFVKHFDQPTLITNEVYFPSNNAYASALYPNVDFKSAISSPEGTYVVGSRGTLLYSNLNDMLSFKGITNVASGDFNAIAIVPSSSSAGFPKAFAVGTQASIYRFYGLTNSKIVNVFPNKIEDVHFYDATHGTMVGENFFVRQTSNGGQTWNIVVPEVNVANQLSKTLNSVWTKEGNRAIIGGVNYLATVNNGFVLDQSFSETIRDIQFSKTNGTLGYLASGNNVRSFSYNYNSSSNAITLNLSSILSNASNQVNALHVFDNGNVMAVGNNSFIGYLAINTGSTTFTNFPTGNSGEKYNAIFFHDYKNGYIGGDQGVLYQTAIVETNPQNVINLLTWSARDNDLVEALAANSGGSRVDINAISFSTRTKGLIGGKYHSNYALTEYKGYVRLISDESQQYGTRFYYDRLGRLVVSQNARQYKDRKFSYTLYDALGRVYEAGEKTENNNQAPYLSVFGTTIGGQEIPSVIDDAKLAYWISGDGPRKEVTRSYYDAITLAGLPANFNPIAENLRKRIAHVTYEAVYDGNDQTYDHATHYNYDIHGNVQTMLQDNPTMATDPLLTHQQFKRLDYNYDLVSGNVHRVSYELGKVDQWHHAYVYDADNRITDVYTTNTTPLTTPSHGQSTSQNEPEISPFWDKEAHYKYYAHGPLARIELGEQKVQGLDYVYTLQGWLKGVNSDILKAENDPGKDGIDLQTNLFARDVMGYSLHYFEEDYKGIGSASNNRTADQTGSDLTANSADLFNGNIARMVTTITNPDTREILPLGNAYKYDQLNRIKESRSFPGLNISNNSWGNSTYANMYYNDFSYEANGNILSQNRYNSGGDLIDKLAYHYQRDDHGRMLRNRLYHVNDEANSATFDDDIDDMGEFVPDAQSINTDNNYSYDEEGRLIKDVQEEIEKIVWRVDGKVKNIIRLAGSEKKNLTFEYNAMGQRIAKHVMNADNELEKSTYYVLDAQGNTMSVYERVVDNTQSSVQYYQAENHIYGSSRLGMQNTHVNLLGSVPLEANMVTVDHQIGLRNYELSNHLGNVLTVISDKPIPHDDGNGAVDYFMADIRKATDYSPFGVILEKRNFEVEELITLERIVTTPVAQDSVLVSAEEYIHYTDFESPVISTQTYGVTYQNVEGWTNFSGSQLSVVNMSGSTWMKIVSTVGTHGANKYLILEPSTNYVLDFDVNLGMSTNISVVIGSINSANGVSLITSSSIANSGTQTVSFTTPASLPMGVVMIQIRQSGTYYVDNVKVRKVSTNQIIHSTNFESGIQVSNAQRTYYDGWYSGLSNQGLVSTNTNMKRLQINYGSAFDCLYKVVDVTPGVTYRFKAKIIGGQSGNVRIMQRPIGNTGVGTLLQYEIITTNNGYVEFNFTPTNTQVVFTINNLGTFYLEDVAITKSISTWKYSPMEYQEITPTYASTQNVSQNGNQLVKLTPNVGWGLTGAIGDQAILSGDYVEFEIGNETMTLNRRALVAISYTAKGYDVGADFGWYLSPDFQPHILTSGVSTTIGGTWQVAGKKYRILRENATVKFYENGVLKGTYTDKYPDRPMYLDVAMYEASAKIYNLKIGKSVRKLTESTVETYTVNVGGYRYSFQGQEHDDEIKGKGNSVNYQYRMHDSRLGRFFAVDPLAPEYPHNSPYAFSENRLLDGVELEGLEFTTVHHYNIYNDKKGNQQKVFSHTTKIDKNATPVQRVYRYFDAEGNVIKTMTTHNGEWAKFIERKINTDREGDYAGIVQNATDADYENNYGKALVKDISADIFNAFYPPIDDAIAITADDNVSNTDKVLSWIPVIFATKGGARPKSGRMAPTKLKVGDQLDLKEFNVREKGTGNLIHEKSGYKISKDKLKDKSHGGSAYKLLDKDNNRIGTIDKEGTILRE